jgi:ABC-type multidrug transport system fused ATPase/permease subunit
VRFERVSFSYGATPVIRGLSFAIEPGELAVMVGDSGAGKSTVARLLLRFYDPQEGRILVDDVSVRDLARETLHRNLSYVGQEVFLFDGTIDFNVRIGKPDATDAEVAEALRVACLDDFVAELPDGVHTLAGERGVRLSGGQRQRIAIARAVLTSARILVLDEATSALDMELEQRILERLVNTRGGRTLFAVTHRLSLAEIADRVMVLRDGMLVEEGSAQDLAAADGEYARLLRAGQASGPVRNGEDERHAERAEALLEEAARRDEAGTHLPGGHA